MGPDQLTDLLHPLTDVSFSHLHRQFHLVSLGCAVIYLRIS